MPHFKYQVQKRFTRLVSRHYRGFGIDSPYTYHLVRDVIEAKMHYYPFKKLDRQCRKVISKINEKSRDKALSEEESLCLKNELDRLNDCTKLYRFLFRLVNYLNPECLAFIGDDSGLLLSYYAKIDSRRDILSLGSRKFASNFSRLVLKEQAVSNVQFCDFSSVKKSACDFIHISGSVDANVLLEFEDNLEVYLNKESYLVIENIHRDDKMIRLWDRLKAIDRFNVSLDLFDIGILIARKGLNKQDYNLSASSYK